MRHLDPQLCPADYRSAIVSLAAKLPPCGLAGFECRLGTLAPATDFQIKVPDAVSTAPGDSSPAEPWRHVARVSRELRNEASALHRSVRAMALEFDVDPTRDVPRPPAAFAVIRRHAGRDPEALAAVAAAIGDGRVSPRLRDGLAACLEACPPHVRVRHLGAMVSRPGRALRVNLNRTPARGVAQIVRTLGWEGDLTELEARLVDLDSACDVMVVACDLMPELSPRIGLELFTHPAAGGTPTWHALADRLVGQRVCSPSQREALVGWCGRSQLTNGSDRPDALQFRDLSHFKLVVDPGRPINAKAYLSFNAIPLREDRHE